MPGTFYPQSGPELAVFIDSLLAFATANLLALGLVPGDIAPLTASQNEFKNSLLTQTNASNAYGLATEQRYINQSAVISELSAFNSMAQDSSVITDPQREGMGLPVYDTTQTPVPVPLTRPVLQIDTSQRLQHTISFSPRPLFGCDFTSRRFPFEKERYLPLSCFCLPYLRFEEH